MAARAVGEQSQLLLLYPVLCLASLTVQLVVKLLWITGEVGHNEAGIFSLLQMFGFDDYSALLVPRIGCIQKLAEYSLLLLHLFKPCL